MPIAKNITELVGRTPMMHISTLSKDSGATIIGKLEFFNPLSSIKDRVAVAMINAAEKNGALEPGALIIEPTSGNTGIGLAFVAASRGYRLILTMPETMSLERQKLLKILGAEVVLTAGELGMRGAVEKAEQLHAVSPGSFMPQQFKNPVNPAIHRLTTAEEIWRDCDGKVDLFIAGVGTGGTISGCGAYLKERNPAVKIIAVEPEESAVLSGGSAGVHSIQGIGAGFIPEVLNRDILDGIVTVSAKEAASMVRLMAVKEGVLIGISSGAALVAAVKVGSDRQNRNKSIVAVLPDSGERYLSTWIYDDI